MGLINWIFDIYQHTQIDKAKSEAAQARVEAASIRASNGTSVDTERLERALGELALATKTIQRMMLDKGVCTGEEFAAKLNQVDLEDGRVDGRTGLPG